MGPRARSIPSVRFVIAAVLFASLPLEQASATSGQITTYAGGGKQHHAEYTHAVATDENGNVYYTVAYQVFRLSPEGVTTLVAGNGEGMFGGSCGDGGPAVDACLAWPHALVVDAAGNLFINEWSRIRRVGTSGIITTVAGNGTHAQFCGDGGPAVQACISAQGMAVHASGDLYFADSLSHRVRRVDADGVITTVVGNGTDAPCGDGGAAADACLSYPWDVAFDAAGTLFIADAGNDLVRTVSPEGMIHSVAGTLASNAVNRARRSFSRSQGPFCGDGGRATSACLAMPTGVEIGDDGTLFIADSMNLRVRAVDPSGVIRTVAGNGLDRYCGDHGPATEACIGPSSLALASDGRLLICCGRIRQVDATGTITTLIGWCAPTGPVQTACFQLPFAIGFDPSGSVMFSTPYEMPLTVDESGFIHRKRLRNQIRDCEEPWMDEVLRLVWLRWYALACPFRVGSFDHDPAGNLVFVDPDHPRVWRADPSGNTEWIAGSTLLWDVWVPGVCITPFGPCYGGITVRPPFPTEGDGLPGLAARLIGPSDVAVDADGAVYIADRFNHRIRRLGTDGIITTVAGGRAGTCGDGGAAIGACLQDALSVAVDTGGNLFISDGNRVRRVDRSTGIITTIAGTIDPGYCGDGGPAVEACLRYPAGMAFDTAGNLYVADRLNHAIRRIDPSGTITTVAGGRWGFCGDGGPAVDACLRAPADVAVDSNGNLFIADTFNNRIRRVAA